LEHVTLPDCLVEIGTLAFSHCTRLKEAILPGTLVNIGASAFYGCVSLSHVTLPKKLKMIDFQTFSNCSNLEHVTLPDCLVEIGTLAFSDCTRLKEAILPGTLVAIGDYAFRGCTRLTTATLPDSLQEIGKATFDNCRGLVAIRFPNNPLLSVSLENFADWTSLVDLELPASIPAGSFAGCINLRTLILPSRFAGFGGALFNGSIATLRMVVVPHTLPTEVSSALIGALFEPAGWGRARRQPHPRHPRVGARQLNLPFSQLFHQEPDALDFVPAASAVQLVSAPDAVVARLGGVFAEMTTMAEVRAARRDVTSLDHHYWTVKTHEYQISTSNQRACAHMVLLVGARLYFRPHSSTESTVDAAAVSIAIGSQIQLPPLPDEIWLHVLTWLRRSQLGGCEP
jgi:hypothetical protein